MTGAFDVAVIGAGPAGIGAALSAAGCGLRVVIFDEAARAGGQVYRALPEGFTARDAAALGPDHAIGEALRRDLAASGVEPAFGRRVWMIKPGFTVHAIGDGAPEVAAARAVVVATGTHEREIPVPGWTTPGVIGLAAATILLKSDQMLPGTDTVVAGCGPLLAAVAAGILAGGGRVAAVVDLAGPSDWVRALPALAARPDLLRKGLGWMVRIRRAGVPMYFRHVVTSVAGRDNVDKVTINAVDGQGHLLAGRAARTIAADCVAIGYGLIPGTDITRLLRARHVFRPERGGWVAERDRGFRSSVRHLYVAGDGAGISGAAAALLQGRIAGLTAAGDLGAGPDATADIARLQAALARAERFGAAMARLMTPPPGLIEIATPDTVICRCEDVTRQQIEQAVDAGARELNQLKAWTRCGMGPCQGRVCGDAAASLLARKVGGRMPAGQWTGRTPLRPIPLHLMIGSYRYEDIWAMQRGNFPPPMPFDDAVAGGARRAMSDGLYDVAVVGGGVLGCSVALHLARGGMRVALLEKGAVCRGASGVNAGTFFVQSRNINVPMQPYVTRSLEMWRTTQEWLGVGVGFQKKGGLILAFTNEEAEQLTELMRERQAAGAPIELVGRNRAQEIEPGLSGHPVLASYCPIDGYANSNQIGFAFRQALLAGAVDVREQTAVTAIEQEPGGYRLETGDGTVRARRLVMSAGVWLHALAQRAGLRIPIICRVNQVSVTERMPPIFKSIIGSVTGLLTLKQSGNGSVLIGGGWQGIGDPDNGGVEVMEENLIGNFRLACYAVPGIARARVTRTWLGLDGQVTDNMPVIGEIPGHPDAYILGCVRAGFTIGPFIGRIFAQTLLGVQPDLPIFDPAFSPSRFAVPAPASPRKSCA